MKECLSRTDTHINACTYLIQNIIPIRFEYIPIVEHIKGVTETVLGVNLCKNLRTVDFLVLPRALV
jgi:hypothetical protein